MLGADDLGTSRSDDRLANSDGLSITARRVVHPVANGGRATEDQIAHQHLAWIEARRYKSLFAIAEVAETQRGRGTATEQPLSIARCHRHSSRSGTRLLVGLFQQPLTHGDAIEFPPLRSGQAAR